MVPRPKRPRSQPPGTRHTPAGARWRNSRARIQPASVQPRQHANPAQPAHQPSRAHLASAGIRMPTPRGGERVARDSVFGRSGSKVRTTRFPLPPKTAQASRRTPQNCKFFFPVLANLELHDACPPRNLIRQFPHRPKTAFPASASFPVRNISAPSVPQAPPQPTARRPVHGSETAAHAPGDRPARGRRAPDAPHFAPMLRVSGVARKLAPQFLRVSGVVRTECPRACRFPGLCEKPNSHNPENSHTPSPHADSGKLSPRYILHSLTRNLFRCRRFHASTSNAGIVGPLGIQ